MIIECAAVAVIIAAVVVFCIVVTGVTKAAQWATAAAARRWRP